MATESVETTPSEPQSEYIDHLRGIAENHLRQIAEEKLQEEFDGAKRNEELERYAKQRRRDKLRSTSPTVSMPTCRMRSAQGKLASQLRPIDQLIPHRCT